MSRNPNLKSEIDQALRFVDLGSLNELLLETAKTTVQRWERGDLAEAVRDLGSVIEAIEGMAQGKEHHYRVSWEIDIDGTANSPEDAARQARAFQLDPESTATVFRVHNLNTGRDVTVDLDELDQLRAKYGTGKTADEMFGFRVGDTVRMLIETMGCDEDDEEVTFPPGTLGEIVSINWLGDRQGWGMTVVIGGRITNVFDQGDGLPETRFFEAVDPHADKENARD